MRARRKGDSTAQQCD
nr:hypothetical protein [Escherichia coli]